MRMKSAILIISTTALLATSASRAAQPAPPTSISGAYQVPELSNSQAAQFSSPLMQLDEMKPSSRLELHVELAGPVRIAYVARDGAPVEKLIDLAESGCARDHHAIVCEAEVANVGARILPGVTKQLKRITYRRDEHGNLQLVRNHIEKGLVLFVIPFHENHESSLTFARIR